MAGSRPITESSNATEKGDQAFGAVHVLPLVPLSLDAGTDPSAVTNVTESPTAHMTLEEEQRILPPNHASPQRTRLIMLALCTSVFVVSLDTFIVTTALPTIALDFTTSDAGYAWIGSAYILSFGVVVPVWANISTVFGRKPIIIITTGIFFAGTLIGALSNSAAVLIAGRAIQGVGGGGLTVLVNICVGDLFSMRYVR